jgi:hypothetical protein
MFHYFDGSVNKRSVNLGRKTKTSSRSKLLNDVKQNREERNRHLQQLSAATAIAAWYRATIVRREIRRIRRAELLARLRGGVETLPELREALRLSMAYLAGISWDSLLAQRIRGESSSSAPASVTNRVDNIFEIINACCQVVWKRWALIASSVEVTDQRLCRCFVGILMNTWALWGEWDKMACIGLALVYFRGNSDSAALKSQMIYLRRSLVDAGTVTALYNHFQEKKDHENASSQALFEVIKAVIFQDVQLDHSMTAADLDGLTEHVHETLHYFVLCDPVWLERIRNASDEEISPSQIITKADITPEIFLNYTLSAVLDKRLKLGTVAQMLVVAASLEKWIQDCQHSLEIDINAALYEHSVVQTRSQDLDDWEKDLDVAAWNDRQNIIAVMRSSLLRDYLQYGNVTSCLRAIVEPGLESPGALHALSELVWLLAVVARLSPETQWVAYGALSKVMLPQEKVLVIAWMWDQILDALKGRGPWSRLPSHRMYAILGLICNGLYFASSPYTDDELFFEPEGGKGDSQSVSVALLRLEQWRRGVEILQATFTTVISATIVPIGVVHAMRLYSALFARQERCSFAPDQFWLLDDPALSEALQAWLRDIVSHFTTDDESLPAAPSIILQRIPFVLPLPKKIAFLQRYLHQRTGTQGSRHKTHLNIRRGFEFADGFAALGGNSSSQWWQRWDVVYQNEHGLNESGIDAGGLFREYLGLLILETFNPDSGLFAPTDDLSLYPRADAHIMVDSAERKLRFAGRVLGKAICSSILTELRLSPFIVKQLLSFSVGVDDLKYLDPELFRNMSYLKTYEGDWEDLSLSFAVDRKLSADQAEGLAAYDLIPHGSEVAVTAQNRLEYVNRLARFRMVTELRQSLRPFQRGLYDLLPSEILSLFSAREFQTMISGVQKPFDVDDLQANTVYLNDEQANSPEVAAFWEVLASFTEKEKLLFLKFVTSLMKPPLLGFQQLEPKFQISLSQKERLPSASTCFNMLKLPAISDKNVLRERLLYAITSGAGFELS